MSDASAQPQPSITVGDFVAAAPTRLELRVLAGGRGLASRRITSERIQKLGLALSGFTHYIHAGRVQIIGQSEVLFLGQLTPDARRAAIDNLSLETISCVLVTKEQTPPPEFVEAAERVGLPLLQTTLVSSVAIGVVTDYLRETLAPRELRHGVLLDAYGLGVLIEGESGIGKSECALDLIVRGHRLVADDLVEVRRLGADYLLGSAPELLREHMEIRGLGIINVRDLYGVAAVSGPKQVGLSIRLERWADAREVERLGIDEHAVEILGVSVPHVLLPVSPGRNLSTLVETALRVHLLRLRGYNAAEDFVARHTRLLGADRKHAGSDAATAAGRQPELIIDEPEKKSSKTHGE
ncbi:MAG: HPr kinase/phosphorylase [Acidobacteriota bacterium]|nr:HPr kinase/phosphorylase [Acidobacteriota bacterium]